MKRYFQFLTIVLSAAALVACSEIETPLELADGREISFTATIGNFQVKATDTAFEKGDVIGLFADDPVSANNARITWDGKALVPETPLHWGLNQDVNQSVSFYAYYPYAGSAAKQFTFTVPADQSTAQGFAAADLMLASTTAAPADESVRLNFAHRMARVVFDIDYRLSSATVTEVLVSGVALSADVNLTVPSVKASGEVKSVKAAPVSNDSGAKAWAVIVPGQACEAFALTVKLSDGSSVDIPAVAVTLTEGRSYRATVIIDQSIAEPVFSASVTDWLDYWLYLGKDEDPGIQEHTWYVQYNDELYPFEELEDGTFHQVFCPGESWVEIRLIKDDYVEAWGSAIPTVAYYVDEEDDTEVCLLAPNYGLYIGGQTGCFDLVLDVKAKTLTIKMLENNWVSLGTGKMIDDIVSYVWGAPHEEFDVEVLVREHNPRELRIVNPYANWSNAEYFNYKEGGYIDLHIKSDNTVWMSYSELGLNHPNYGNFYAYGAVDEMGLGDYNYYGTYYPRYGYIRFYDRIAFGMDAYGEFWSNINGMTILTLPGYERPESFRSIEAYATGAVTTDEDGNHYLEIRVHSGMDVSSLGYAVYAGHLSRYEVYGDSQDGLYYTQVRGNATPIPDFYPDEDVMFYVPLPQTGTYTIVYDAVDKWGNHVGSFFYYWMQIDGEVPELALEVSAEPLAPMADLQIKGNVKFADPASLYTLMVKEETYVAAGLTDDDVYDVALTYGRNQNINYLSSGGTSFLYTELPPQTEYRFIVAGETNFGVPGWAFAKVTTEAAPEFTSLGTGHYHDAFFDDKFDAEVEVLKANMDVTRYRVMDPYTEFWKENAEAYGEEYYGWQSPWIDCYVDGDKFVYGPYYNGYYVTDLEAAVVYKPFNRYAGYFYPLNRELQEGVFNFAPYAEINGTNYYYNLTDWVGEIYLELPGYTYTPAAAAPAALSRKKAVTPYRLEAPVAGTDRMQKEVNDVKRHMLNTGAPKVVRPQHLFTEISAEPLK